MSTATRRPLGPVDLAVIGFAGELRQGGVRQAIADAVDRGAVRVLDVLLVRKDADGKVLMFDAESSGDSDELLGFPTELPDLVGEEDARAIADEMPLDSTVLVIAWENSWAAQIAASIDELGGQVLVMERIPSADVNAVIDAWAEFEEEPV
ncbi:MAG TPA: DUF6325 family protein [Ornithinibacter sp.]|nr:DUF6325 family protein [Ornithinibacter sp.]